MYRGIVLLLLVFSIVPLAGAQNNVPEQIDDVRIEQRLGESVPLDLVFRDSTGKRIRLKKYFDGEPVILVMAYYRCPRLCSVVINNLIDSLRRIPHTAGREFHVVIVSFDPIETIELAARNKELCLERYGRSEYAAGGWHFLTGEEEEIRQLADAVGFRYIYDPEKKIYKHGAGIMILTPQGKVARYLFGVDFEPRDLRLALLEASDNKISTPVDNVLLLTCLAYDPTTGKYSVAVYKLVRLAAIITLACLGFYLVRNWMKEKRSRKGRSQRDERFTNVADTRLSLGTSVNGEHLTETRNTPVNNRSAPTDTP